MRKNVKKQLALRVLSTAALMAMVSSIATAAFAAEYNVKDGSVEIVAKDGVQSITQWADKDEGTYVTDDKGAIKDREDSKIVLTTKNKDTGETETTHNTVTITAEEKGDTANVTLKDVDIEVDTAKAKSGAIEIKGDGNTNLELNGNNTVLTENDWEEEHAAIEKADKYGTGTLTISGTGRMTNFTSDSPAPWADQADQITNVEVEGTVTSIGAVAFKGCTNLTTVNIADGVEYIEAGAFNGCTALTDITIPDSVGYIKTGAFKDCSALTSVTIRDDCRLDMNVFPTTVEVNHSEG